MALLGSFAGLRLGEQAASVAPLRAARSSPGAPARGGLLVQAEGASSAARRIRRHNIIRKKVVGSEERPRLAVFRSNQHIYAQVIDDSKNVTLVGLGSVSKSVREALGEDGDKKSATKSKDAAAVVGRLLAEKCKEKGIEMVVFDRGGFKYHGRISALADAAREAGLVF